MKYADKNIVFLVHHIKQPISQVEKRPKTCITYDLRPLYAHLAKQMLNFLESCNLL